jgi:hypothetical protein
MMTWISKTDHLLVRRERDYCVPSGMPSNATISAWSLSVPKEAVAGFWLFGFFWELGTTGLLFTFGILDFLCATGWVVVSRLPVPLVPLGTVWVAVLAGVVAKRLSGTSRVLTVASSVRGFSPTGSAFATWLERDCRLSDMFRREKKIIAKK